MCCAAPDMRGDGHCGPQPVAHAFQSPRNVTHQMTSCRFRAQLQRQPSVHLWYDWHCSCAPFLDHILSCPVTTRPMGQPLSDPSPTPPTLRVIRCFFRPTLCGKLSKPIFGDFNGFPLILVDFQCISNDSLSFSISFSQFQSASISCNQLQSVSSSISLTWPKTAEFIDNRKAKRHVRVACFRATNQSSSGGKEDLKVPRTLHGEVGGLKASFHRR